MQGENKMYGVFKYDSFHSYETNFQIWYDMNCREKRNYNEPSYSPEEAREVFDNIYEKKLAHSIKINKDGILEDVLVEE